MVSRIELLLYALPGAALALSLLLFLMYVPMVSILSIVAVLLALSLVFVLGVAVGSHRSRISRWLRRLQNAR